MGRRVRTSAYGSTMLVDPNVLPFRELVDATPDGILVTGERGTILLVNAEA